MTALQYNTHCTHLLSQSTRLDVTYCCTILRCCYWLMVSLVTKNNVEIVSTLRMFQISRRLSALLVNSLTGRSVMSAPMKGQRQTVGSLVRLYLVLYNSNYLIKL